MVAFAGAMVAESCCVPPINMDAVVGLTVTPVTRIGLTVITDVAVRAPSAVVAVMVAVPTLRPVTNPLVLTVAIDVLLLPQVTL